MQLVLSGQFLLQSQTAFAVGSEDDLPVGLGLAAGAIVALHPLQVEVVPAVARNIDLLLGVFTLLALLMARRGAFVATVLAAMACALMLGLGNTLGHKRLQAALMAAPIRQKECSLAINEHGIASEGGALHSHVEWSDVTEIAEMGSFVLIMLSPLEYIPIPEFSLPPDLSRTELVETLREWHEAARQDFSEAEYA